MGDASGAIRVGVVGVSRGLSFAHAAPHVGMELVALCDTWEEKLATVSKDLGVASYVDYEEFLGHDMDAVVLANYFHQHAPFAVKALGAGLHVMSECAACGTLGEGVALARAVERSGKTYMFAENYPYMVYNQEMRRLYLEGAVGEFKYGEGEYIHPMDLEAVTGISPGMDHWRNWIPATYYCTHAVAPVMFITGTRPEKVNGFVVAYDHDDPQITGTVRRSDTASIIVCRMDNGAVMKAAQVGLRGHGNYTRIHGNRGLMENCRCGDQQSMRLRVEPFDAADGELVDKVYMPDFPSYGKDAAEAGHGGGDYFTSYHFAEAIRENRQPYLDVYRGIDMSIVGILAWKSALSDSAPLEVPDFRDEAQRKLHEDDHWTPDPARSGPRQPPSSLRGDIEPTEEARERATRVWRENGYTGE